MSPFGHMGPELFDRPWWGTFGWLLPLLLVAGLTGLVVWAVLRTSGQPAVAGGPPPAMTPAGAVAMPTAGMVAPILTPPGIAGDPAFEAARLRYARGEMSRDEFLRVSRDLGAPAATLEPSEEGGADA